MKIVLREDGHDEGVAAWDGSTAVVTAVVTYVEVRAAVAAAARARRITPRVVAAVRGELERRWSEVVVLEVDEPCVRRAGALAEQHALRGYDAVHLAAAVGIADLLATWDRDLSRAAREAGLAVAP